MGGGGRNTVTQTSGVPDWLRPDVQRAFGSATQAHQAGELDGTPVYTQAQEEAERIQGDLARDAIQGRGAFDIESQLQRDLDNTAGRNLAGLANSGGLSSARADAARQGALADRSLQHQLTRQQAQSQGTQALRDLGQLHQGRAQQAADSKHTGLQRLFGYYGSGAQGSQQTQSGGGGK